jgi:hypothetical protein
MSSIILSFVGEQDPYSDKTRDEGSIVSLVNHLVTLEQSLKKVILLYTDKTKDRAELTQEWLKEEMKLLDNQVEILPVNNSLSQDPVNLQLAVQEARQCLDYAKTFLDKRDKIEFNASSGTPVMKSAWNILQAAGYAPKSSVWQVRNPKQMEIGQERIFTTNIEVLTLEFDRKIVQRQIHDFNYSGALASLQDSSLLTDKIMALLSYADARLAFDFDKAFRALNRLNLSKDDELYPFIQDISSLRQKQPEALLKEAYFKILIKLSNQEFAECLILLSTLHETILTFLVKRKFLARKDWGKKWSEVKSEVWSKIQGYDQGELYKYLKQSIQNLESLGFRDTFKRVVIMKIINYDQEFSNLRASLNYIDQYYSLRNDIIHQLEGISEIPEKDQLFKNLKQVIRLITYLPEISPFERLNQIIINCLDINP